MQRYISLSVIVVVVYLAVLGLQTMEWRLPIWVSNYAEDLLCIPLLLSLTLLTVRYWKYNYRFQLSKVMLIFIVGYVSWVFEWILPKLSSHFTADPYDVLCYCIGALFFFRFQQKEFE